MRTNRERLLVAIAIAKAQHMAQVRLPPTRVLDKQLSIPNTQAGCEPFWAHLQARQRETGVTGRRGGGAGFAARGRARVQRGGAAR